jgi:tRNA 2-selenouridine synthase
LPNLISIEEALKLKNILFIDVRSPSEFNNATIPKAINIPILDDMERAVIGKIYNQEKHDQATLTGLDYVSTKLPNIYRIIKEYASKYSKLIIFCWRGGMRSNSICTFINMLNIKNAYQLIGGYKAYRKFLIDFINKETHSYRFIMLHGLTGVGKTAILDKLQSLGKPVLNLERLAKNSGSVFGEIAFIEKMPTQKMFDSYVFDVIYNSLQKNIFIESESKKIGDIQIIDPLYKQMLNGYHVLIETTLENRINRILADYMPTLKKENGKIKESLNRLRQRLGNKVINDLLKKIEEEKYIDVIRYLMVFYYDPLYQYSLNQLQDYDLVINYNHDITEIIPILLEFEKNIQN